MTGSVRRRLVTVPATFAIAVVFTLLAAVWLPVAVVVDVLTGRSRLPLVRLGLCLTCCAWLEVAGITVAACSWATGRARQQEANLRLQRWWIAKVIATIRLTTGARIEMPSTHDLADGPLVMLCRHASLADSVLSAWAVAGLAGMAPRYVLKRELLSDPCLDIVGSRLPNYFLDREASDSSAELAALTELSRGMGSNDIAIIFPEGTRASDSKRQRILGKLAEHDPERADRLAGLRHLIPPRPGGARALLEGSPCADVVLAWHTGFEGWNSFAGVVRRLAHRAPVIRFATTRVARVEVPTGAEFSRWLDERWLQIDAEVDMMLAMDQQRWAPG